MKHTGIIRKMVAKNNNPIDYFFSLSNELVYMNELIGKQIHLSFLGEIHCISCDRKTKKSFAQGYCYPCFISLPETDECILHPEKCLAQEGVSRDMEWAKDNCLQEHVVYLAVSSGLKVGVTRATQVPTRWIDQGALQTIILAKTPNRNLAGLIEVSLKKHLADKTNWRKMLTNSVDQKDLLVQKKNVQELLDEEYSEYITDDNEVWDFSYPVKKYPDKVKSINLEKIPEFTKVFSGIKGQYLIFEDDFVINIRKYGGYFVSLEY